MPDWILTLIIVGLVLIFIEIFFIPGMGFFGVIGSILLMIGIYFVGKEKGAVWASVTFFGSGVLIAGFFYLFFRSPASNWLISKGHLKSQSERAPETVLEVGLHGTATTPLYPTGKANFRLEGEEKSFDVSTEAEFLDKGSKVLISRIEGNRVFVRRYDV